MEKKQHSVPVPKTAIEHACKQLAGQYIGMLIMAYPMDMEDAPLFLPPCECEEIKVGRRIYDSVPLLLEDYFFKIAVKIILYAKEHQLLGYARETYRIFLEAESEVDPVINPRVPFFDEKIPRCMLHLNRKSLLQKFRKEYKEWLMEHFND